MHAAENEKGFALILALVMLVLLTILGAYVLSTSSTEMFIAGNYKNAQRAFYAADAGEEYGQRDGTIYAAILPGTASQWPAPGAGNGTTSTDYQSLPMGDTSADVKVKFVMSGELPAGAGSSSEDFQANYFVVTSIGLGPANARIDVECLVAKIVPKN